MQINQPTDGTCGYVAFYNGKRIEVYANSSYEAQQKVANHFKVKEKKRYLIHVVLAEINGKPNLISTASL